jgi:transposase
MTIMIDEGSDRFLWLAPMVLWPLAEPNLPLSPARPQGGGAQRVDEQALFAAVVYILVTGSPWRALPRIFGVSWQNSHRRFIELTQNHFWERLRAAAQSRDPGTSAARWADLLAQAAQRRIRQRHASERQQGTSDHDAQPVWCKPTLLPVDGVLAGRLFELRDER